MMLRASLIISLGSLLSIKLVSAMMRNTYLYPFDRLSNPNGANHAELCKKVWFMKKEHDHSHEYEARYSSDVWRRLIDVHMH